MIRRPDHAGQWDLLGLESEGDQAEKKEDIANHSCHVWVGLFFVEDDQYLLDDPFAGP